MRWGLEDTIAAISTPLGEGGIGIVRVTGPKALAVAEKIFRGRGRSLEKTPGYRVRYGFVINPETGERLDEVLAVVLRAPHSFTREDTVEFNCHGGPLPTRQVLAAALRAGARLAEPGEFTRRAFLNGRLDLAQAEATLDLIRAQTERGARAALGQLAGRLSEKIRSLSDRLLRLLASVEVGIDFPEDDVEEATRSTIDEEVGGLLAEIQDLLARSWEGKILREGLRTAIVGLPNVGKSSLLNALLKEERAIVTAIPGTTRDVLEERINVRGIPVVIMDTAGLRESEDLVEQLGVARTREALRRAEMILLVLDDSAGLRQEEREILREIGHRPVVVFINKIDLGEGRVDPGEVVQALEEGFFEKDGTGGRAKKKYAVVQGSARLGQGLEDLEAAVERVVLEGGVAAVEEEPLVTNVRHVGALERAAASLREVRAGVRDGLPYELLAVDLREAWEALGEVTGETAAEGIIDEIFARFCVGK